MTFATAAVCRLGHVVSRDAREDPPPAQCRLCGKHVMTTCHDCDEPIRGPEYKLEQGPTPGQLVRVWKPGGYKPPLTCHRCEKDHPWAFGHAARRSERQAS